MYVRNHMLHKDKLTSVTLDENIGSVLKKINEGDFLSLPVVDNDELKGIIMKEAIFRDYFDKGFTDKEDFLANRKVKDLYNNKYESINEEEKIEKASYLLKKLSTPFLAVLDSDDNFVGILTHFAIFNAFSDVFGSDKGSRIVVNMLDKPGQIARLTDILRKERANILNFAIVDPKLMGIIRVILRVETDDLDDLIVKIQDEGFRLGESIKQV